MQREDSESNANGASAAPARNSLSTNHWLNVSTFSPVPPTPQDEHRAPSVRSQQGSAVSAMSTADNPEEESLRSSSQDDGDIGTSLGSARGLGIHGDDLHQNTTHPTIIHVNKPHQIGRRDEPDSSHQSFGSRSERTFSQSASSSARLLGEFSPYSFTEMKGLPNKSPKKAFAYDSPSSSTSRSQIWDPRLSRVYGGLVALSIFSTALSTVYFSIAVGRLPYGDYVSNDGKITPSAIEIVYALFAKLIEMSFVAVFVAFIGQVVSRRGFMRTKDGGMTMAEMSMRSWLTQPGTMLVRLESMRHGALTRLGALTVVATIAAMLYTTAAQTLVKPHLEITKFGSKEMFGLVKTAFGNHSYVETQCKTPVNLTLDPSHKAETCIKIQNAAQTYNDYQFYLSKWSDHISQHPSSDISHRPPGTAKLPNSTDVTGSWINIANMSADFETWGRTVVNVTLAFPHAGIIRAASDPINRIPQPKTLDGFGAYEIHAAIASPMVNVLCANISKNELGPMLRKASDHNVGPTMVDDLFKFGPSYGNRLAPIWNSTDGPAVYGSILNDTGAYGAHDAIYLLSKGADGLDWQPIYSMCSIRAGLTDRCSTRYNVTALGSRLWARCEDPSDHYQFSKHRNKNVPFSNGTMVDDWVENAFNWITAVNLGAGTEGLNDSNERLLSELIPKDGHNLNPILPSISEALAEMAGTTLLSSTKDAPFVDFLQQGIGNWTINQHFDAEFSNQQYMSGPRWFPHHLLYIPLTTVFFGNILILFWLLIHRGVVTDLTDPLNLFTVSINSPPSHMFTRRSGSGPHGKQYKTPWFVGLHEDRLHMENGDERLDNTQFSPGGGSSTRIYDSPVARKYWELSRKKKSFF